MESLGFGVDKGIEPREDDHEGLGDILYRLSHTDENLEQWKEKQNEIRSCNGVATGGVDSARKVDVCEIYSPPRITLQARKHGLRPGEAMDLMTGYDFDKEEDRQRAWKILEKDKPMLLVGSPECRMFSTLQNMNRWTNKKQKEYESAR